MGNEATPTTTEAAAAGPSASRIKKTARKALEEAGWRPTITMKEVRDAMQRELAAKYPAFDWASAAFKAETKAAVAGLVAEHEQQQAQQEALASDKKRPASAGDNDKAAGEDEQERRRRKQEEKEQKKAKLSDSSGASSVASASSASTSTGGADTVYKRLAKCVLALDPFVKPLNVS